MSAAAPAPIGPPQEFVSVSNRQFSERQRSLAAIVLFSVAFFVPTLIRASEKRFWFDELCTYYICRLPTFQQSWAAVMHGADFNPPLFYVIQRANAALFGFGLIGFRIPEMLGFWTLCICLFSVSKRHVGVLGGFLAMTFPVISGAYFYSYEARPHALVLGFAGIALLSWSKLLEQSRSKLWIVLFALSLQCMFLVHCYAVLIAVPFALVELVRAVYLRKINWSIWAALALPGVIATASFLPILRSFGKYLGSAPLTHMFPPTMKTFTAFYQTFFQPCTVLFLVLLLMLAIEQIRPKQTSRQPISGDRHAAWLLLLGVAFLGMPLYGILLAKMVHGPFFARYFSSVAIGAGIALSFSLYNRSRSRWARVLAGFVLIWILFDAGTVVWHRAHGWGETLIEPSSGYGINTDPHDSLETYTLLRGASDSLPIAVPSLIDYLYLLHYWPAARSRLFVIIPSKLSSAFLANRGLFEYCHLPGHDEVTYDTFLRDHRDFLLFSSQMEYRSLPGELVARGAAIRSLIFDRRAMFLAHLQVGEPDS